MTSFDGAAKDPAPRDRGFDVICAGEALWNVVETPRSLAQSVATGPGAMPLRSGGGTVSTALALARSGLRVGLATVLADDTLGRALTAKIAASGVDVGGIELAQPSRGLVFVRGGARQVLSFREEEQPVSIPAGWSSQVLLLSGVSPVVSHGAALCKAARAARRAGSVVVVGVNARWHVWQGRDPRIIRMILREADVVWCSAEDRLALQMEVSTLRAALRPNAVLVRSDGAGGACATGPFGEVACAAEKNVPLPPLGEGDAFVTAICAELVHAGHAAEGRGEVWTQALQRGHAAVTGARPRVDRGGASGLGRR